MAFQEQQQSGQTQEFFEALSRRKWQIILPTLLCLAVGIAWAEFVPRKYDTKTIVELRPMPMPVMGAGMDAQVILRDVMNAEVQVKAKTRVQGVIEDLQWDDYMSITEKQLRSEYVERVRSDIYVAVAGGGKDNPSSFLTVRYRDTNPERAEQFLNHLRDIYITDVVERERNRAREERDKLQDLLNEKQTTYQNSESQLADLKRQYQLSYTQPERNRGLARDEEPVYEQLTRAQGELETALVDLNVAQVVAEDLRRRYAGEPEQKQRIREDSNDALQTQLVDIDQKILEKKQSQQGLRPAHSQWQKAEAEIKQLEELKRDLQEQVVTGVTEFEYVDNAERDRIYQDLTQQESDIARLSARVESLRSSIATLKIRRDTNLEVQRRVNELDNLVAQNQEAYNKTYQAYQDQRTFVELIVGAEGNPFFVLELAEAPRLPTSPNPWVIRILSLIIGIGVGFGSALLGEYGKSGYRTIQEAGRGTSVPVLGAVNRIVTRGESRRRLVQRAAVGLSSVALIGMILWVTWAWRVRPDLLDPGLVQAIEDLRSQFR